MPKCRGAVDSRQTQNLHDPILSEVGGNMLIETTKRKGATMTRQKTAVFGSFKTALQADRAVSRLTSAGFSNSHVSLLKSNIYGLLSGIGIPKNEAKRYEGHVEEGGILLEVHCSNSLEIDRANIILEQNGAEGVFTTREEALSIHGVHRPKHSQGWWTG